MTLFAQTIIENQAEQPIRIEVPITGKRSSLPIVFSFKATKTCHKTYPLVNPQHRDNKAQAMRNKSMARMPLLNEIMVYVGSP
jgi:hypothetical protein